MAATSSASATTPGNGAVDGLVSGLNTTQIIQQLMQVEAQPQQALAAKRDTLTNQVSLYTTLQTNMTTIAGLADGLNISSDWKTAKATSSDTTIAGVSTSSGALPATLNFTVNSLAQANIKSSSGFVTQLTSQAATKNFLIGQGGALGIGQMQGSAGLALGDHTIVVTQVSLGASVSGSALADSVTVASGDTITANISGTPTTINLTAGTYTRRALADMISTASNGQINANVSASKGIALTTAREGSAATLAITGGVNLANLGLTAGGPAATGHDGVMTVDGVSNTLSNIDPNSTTPVTVNGANGDTIGMTFVTGLRLGTLTAKNVSFGDGQLQTVVNNINASNSGIVATAIQVAGNQYKLQLNSNVQGVPGSISIDNTAFQANLGSMDDLVSGKNAKLTVGSGANEYTLYSGSNNVTTMLPGVTVALLKTSTDPVTITVDADYQGQGDKVKALMDAINTQLKFIHDNTSYNATAKTAGPMLGDLVFQQVQQQLIGAVNNMVTKSTFGASSNVGITLQSDGTFQFNEDTFISQYKTNPEGIAQLFIEGGTSGANIDGTSPGIIDRLETAKSYLNDTGTGILWNKIQSGQSQINDYDKSITDWDVRLASKQAQLRQQFSQMEVALGQLKNTQSQIGGQLSQLSA